MVANPSPIGRSVARNFLALSSGELLARTVAFAATIYLARTLGPSLYGVIGFATAVLLYLSRVADFGIDLTGAREIAADPTRLESLAPSVITMRLLIAAGLVVVTSTLALLLLPSPDGTVLAVYAVTLLAVAGGTRWIFYGLERGTAIAVTRTCGEVVMAGLVVLFVHGPSDVVRAPIAQVAGDTAAAVLLALWLTRRGYKLSLGLDWQMAAPVFRRALPLVLAALLGLVIYNSDLIFLRAFSGTRTVGYYAAAYSLISLLVNLGLSYRVSLLPSLTRLVAHSAQQRELYSAAMAHVFAIAIPLGLGGFLLAPQIIGIVFGPAYAEAVPALQLLIWTVPLCLLRDVPSAALLAMAREDQFFRLTAWGAAINVGLNLLLIPRFGMIGAAIATVTTEIVRLCLALAYMHAHGFRVRTLHLFGRVSLAAVGMAALLIVARPPALWVALLLGVGAYAVALVALRALRVRWGELPALRL
jgi:O-antigen/teichoic acid export membrane protein